MLVIAPLALLAWVGVRAAKDEQRRVGERFREVFEGQLADVESLIGKAVGEVERELYSLSSDLGGGTEELRDLVRRNRLVRQVFVRAPDGVFVHPPAPTSSTVQEREFFDRTRSIWESGIRFGLRAGGDYDHYSQNPGRYTRTVPPDAKGGQGSAPPQLGKVPWVTGNAAQVAQQELAPLSDPVSGWHTWFWGDGLNLIYWRQPFPGGPVFGVELERMAFLSDVIAALPTETGLGAGRISLSDARGRPVYQWGDYEQSDGEKPAAERALGVPLEMWRLGYFSGADDTAGQLGAGALTGLVGGLVAAGAALLGIAVFFYRGHADEMRSAAQKVSFVNQVSHELKTPLTNIRMYAELAAEKLGDEADADAGLRKCLDVVGAESGRLGRLIGNVLTFSKRDRAGHVRPAAGDVDEVVAATLEHFRPALAKAGVEIESALGAGGRRSVDGDALEQILANLFNNVEKYAASGGVLKVTTRGDGDTVEIVVEDRGGGVPKAAREKVFEPFVRLSDELTEGVSGTGIGLAIARDLARQHGGDLVLAEPGGGGGCRFVLTLAAPGAQT